MSDADELPRGTTLTAEVPARPAASMIVVRDEPFEVLMLRRHENSSFVPNAWVFPGGVVDEPDAGIARDHASGLDLGPMRVAAVRETFEESGIWLGAPLEDAAQKRRRLLAGSLSFRQILDEAPVDFSRLVWSARWITPVGLPKRFDTWFFTVAVARDVVATAELTEAVEATWVAPGDGVTRHNEGRMQMVFPTIRTLELVARFHRSDDLIEERQRATIETIQPVILENGGRKSIVIPPR